MKMNTISNKLTITDCAAASDGGSLALIATDLENKDISIHLDWSIASQQVGAMQLYVNDVAIPKGTQEEDAWLNLLSDADVNYSYGLPDEALRASVNSMLCDSVDEVVSRVKSDAYQQGMRQ